VFQFIFFSKQTGSIYPLSASAISVFLPSFFVPYRSLLFDGSMQAVQMQAKATQGTA
jgi:hypothetical protein